MGTNEEILELLKKSIDSQPIEERITEIKADIKDRLEELTPELDDVDMLYEFTKLLDDYDELSDLIKTEAYREGFKSGVMLLTKK